MLNLDRLAIKNGRHVRVHVLPGLVQRPVGDGRRGSRVNHFRLRYCTVLGRYEYSYD